LGHGGEGDGGKNRGIKGSKSAGELIVLHGLKDIGGIQWEE
jgi:hypothetical protein